MFFRPHLGGNRGKGIIEDEEGYFCQENTSLTRPMNQSLEDGVPCVTSQVRCMGGGRSFFFVCINLVPWKSNTLQKYFSELESKVNLKVLVESEKLPETNAS